MCIETETSGSEEVASLATGEWWLLFSRIDSSRTE